MSHSLRSASGIVLSFLFLCACDHASQQNPVIEGLVGPSLEIVNGHVLETIVYKDPPAANAGGTTPIPGYPHSSVQVGPDFESAGTLLVITIALDDWRAAQGCCHILPMPGGTPLPLLGQLPATPVNVPGIGEVVIYADARALGIFAPHPGLHLQGAVLSFRYYDKRGNVLGMLSLVGSDAEGKNAGVLVMVPSEKLGR